MADHRLIIGPGELQPHLADPDWVVFDCRHDLFDEAKGARAYAAGHVPGAFFAPVDTVLSGTKTGTNGRHPLPRPMDFAAFLNRHGVTPTTQIVAYDDAGGQYAARLWWQARWIGLTRIAVLDGGLPHWLAEGYAVTTEQPAPRLSGAVVATPDASRLCSAADIMAGISRGESRVVDARAPERYRGEAEPIDRMAGHIPTARNRFFKENLRPDLTMRPPADLKREFEALLGTWRPEEVIHQCGSGVTACANLLAMEHAGLSGSKLYPGSWSEWIADPARPLAQG
ncbi:MAG: sulfurtransferase [Opitutae bacterium]